MDDLINALCGKGREALNEKFVKHALKTDRDHARKRVATLEGKVQDFRDDQATVEKKLIERLPDDELAPPEPDLDASPEKPDFDAGRDPGDEEKEDEEIGKEYLGRKDDTHFYVVSAEGEGEEKDLQIVDQEGKLVYSAKENDLETTDMLHFLIDALKTVPIEGVQVDIFHKYMIPAIEELERKEEEERLSPDDELGGDELDNKPRKPEPESKPFESKNLAETVVVWQNREFNVQLVDESAEEAGTVLNINGKPFRFSETFAQQFKEDDGSMTEDKVKELALDALSALNKEDFDRLALAGKQVAEEGCKGKKKVKEETVVEDTVNEEARKASEVNKGIRQLNKELKQAVKDRDYAKATELSTQLDTIDKAVAGGIENATAAELKKAEDEAAAEKAEPAPADGTGEQPEPGTEPPAAGDAPAANAEVAASTTAASVAEPVEEPVGAAAEGKIASPDKDKDEVIVKKLSEEKCGTCGITLGSKTPYTSNCPQCKKRNRSAPKKDAEKK